MKKSHCHLIWSYKWYWLLIQACPEFHCIIQCSLASIIRYLIIWQSVCWCGNISGSSQFAATAGNTRLLHNGNSTSLGRSSHSGGISRLFGPSSSNNYTTSNNTTSTSLWGSDHSQNPRARDEEEFPNGQILDVANLREFTLAELRAATRNFRHDTVLGKGGFGTVYKGWLKERAARNRGEELTIAIKKMNSDSSQGLAEWQVFTHID